jgi:ABC-type phosphate transport system ATPase subunit
MQSPPLHQQQPCVAQTSVEKSVVTSVERFTEQYQAADTPQAQAVVAKVYANALADAEVRTQLEQQLRKYAAGLAGKQQQAAAATVVAAALPMLAYTASSSKARLMVVHML